MAPMYGNLDFAFGEGGVEGTGNVSLYVASPNFPFLFLCRRSFGFLFALAAAAAAAAAAAPGRRRSPLPAAPPQPASSSPSLFFACLASFSFLLLGFLFSFGFAPRRNGPHVSRSFARTEPGGPGGDPETGPASPPVCKGARARTGRIASGVS